MKKTLHLFRNWSIATITVIYSLVFASCDHQSPKELQKSETPQALQEKSSQVRILSKKSTTDLIDDLYAEAVSKNESLKQLENQVQTVNSSQSDSTASFEN